MNPLISVIVPVYNVRPYLCYCIDCILSQTFIDFELLLVDDGSTDGSGEICDEYAYQDNRIRAFHKVNTGVSDTRNLALDNTLGKYVIFMDADDFFSVDTALEQLFNVAESNHLDIVRGEYKAVDEQGNLLFTPSVSTSRIEFSNRILCSYDFLKYAIQGEFFLPLCLFKKDIIGSLRFESGRIFLEDMQLFSLILLQNLRCMYLPNIQFYAYRKYDGSVSSTVNYQKIKDSFDMCDFFHNLAVNIVEKDTRISQYFHEQSVRIYYCTLEMLSMEIYCAYKKKCIKELDLCTKQKNIYHWIRKYNISVKNVVYYVSPVWGIFYFRLRYYVSRIKNFLRL